ncbi:MAG: ABC transporter permease [Fimbriimonadaceae bacterium]|nr:ABC transporter permease [Fimbriimonadaceae bacterium]QYK54680.1 MAG: ABC transporter permease [Fimbriimonadaceae bacterium]
MNVILSIARTTLGEAIRRRVLLVILLIGVLFLVVAPGLEALSPRQESTVLRALTLGVIQLTSAVIAIVLTVYLIPNEIERRTIYTILSKPVQRWQFLVGKYLGAVGALGLMMALMTGTMLLVFMLMKQNQLDQLGELARVPVLFFAQMALLAAVAVFFSTFVSPIVNFFLSGGVYLLGSVFNSLFESFADPERSDINPLVRGIAGAIQFVIPNFQNFNVQNAAINQGTAIQSEAVYYAGLVGYALAYIGVLLIAGILIFDRREV